MIGILLFCVLYPLSKLLFGRRSEALKKNTPPAVADGTELWDGDQSQNKLLDLWLSPNWGSKGQAQKRMKGQNPAIEDHTMCDTDEQRMNILQDETQTEMNSEIMSVISVKAKDVDAHVGKQQDIVETFQETNRKKENNHCVKLHAKDDDTVIVKDIHPKDEPGAQFEFLHTEESICSPPVMKKLTILSTEESVSPTQDIVQYTSFSVEKVMEIQNLAESLSPARAIKQEAECWAEHLALYDDNLHSGVNPQSHLKLSEQHEPPPACYFPSGPGLADDVHFPLWGFPEGNYHPSLQPMVPLEVVRRVWEDRNDSTTIAEPTQTTLPITKPTMEFTVMSYNILAQDLLEANEQLYTHCPLEVLDWKYRCRLLLEEIQKWAPDILCLQEVQENHYHEELYPAMSQMGYTCVYKRRTGDKTDGCATCYRTSVFSEVAVTPLEFFRPETQLLDRHNVAIVLLLCPVVIQGSEVMEVGPPICVANTHLLFNPRRGDIKLAQLAIVLTEIHSMVKSCLEKGEQCNVVLCGDFNSVPHTPLYRFITTSELYFQGLPAWMVSGQEDLSYKAHCHRLFVPLWPSCLGFTDSCQYITKEMCKRPSPISGKYQYSHDFMLSLRFCPVSCVCPHNLPLIAGVTDNTPDASRIHQPHTRWFRHTITHQLDLESVYKHILPGSGNPEVTTLHSEVGTTVDYIFYSPKRVISTGPEAGGLMSQGLTLTSCLSLLSKDVLWSMNGLPNHIFPSDHLSLLAKFKLELNAV